MAWALGTRNKIQATYRLSSLALALEDLASLDGPDPECQGAVENEV